MYGTNAIAAIIKITTDHRPSKQIRTHICLILHWHSSSYVKWFFSWLWSLPYLRLEGLRMQLWLFVPWCWTNWKYFEIFRRFKALDIHKYLCQMLYYWYCFKYAALKCAFSFESCCMSSWDTIALNTALFCVKKFKSRVWTENFFVVKIQYIIWWLTVYFEQEKAEFLQSESAAF